MKVTAVPRGEASLAAYDRQEMPVRGPVLFRMSQDHPAEVQQGIANLSSCVK